jgi:dihydrofolate reductase
MKIKVILVGGYAPFHTPEKPAIGIGYRNIDGSFSQPYMFKEDLINFKKLTTHNVIVMGRNTWEAIGSKPLPDRTNVVISRNPDFKAEGAKVFQSIDEAITYFKGAEQIYFIGGTTLLEELVKHHKVDEYIITFVQEYMYLSDYLDARLITCRLFLDDYIKKSSKFFRGYNYIDNKEHDCSIAHYIHKDSL